MFSSFLAWLGGTAIEKFFQGLFNSILQGINDARSDAAKREAGQLKQKEMDQQTAIDALRRMEAARAKPIDTEGSLNSGGF